MEKSAISLRGNPSKPIVDIALEHGFSSQASFARAFKKYFNTSASRYRANKDLLESKSNKRGSSQGDICHKRELFDCFSSQDSTKRITGEKKSRDREKIPIQVEVKHVPEKHVIYVRHTGPYRGDSELFAELFGRLFKWANPRDLIKYPETEMLTVYHDSPEITEDNKLRISVCLTVSEKTEVSGEVGKMVIPSGKYAIGHFELSVDQYQEAWNSLFAHWLPESGYQPDDHPCFELYLNHPDEHPEKKHLVDIYLAVKPL